MYKIINKLELPIVEQIQPNTLINGDCLDVMKSIPSGSIDCILADPPYGITQYKWDSVIPLEPMWKELKRVIKPNGAIILFGQGLFTFKLGLSNEKMYRYTIIWEKTRAGGFCNANKMPLQAHEDILIFYKKLPTYNPQKHKGKPYIRKYKTDGDGGNYGVLKRAGTTLKNNGDRFPRSVVKISNDNHNSVHGAAKPVKLLEYLTKTYTNEGETVLDFAAGSFTTGVACVNTNRKFIGIELDQEYFDIGTKRIEETFNIKQHGFTK